MNLIPIPPPTVVGLNKGTKLMPSSFCFDSDGRKAVYTSSGVWKELKEGGTEDDEIVSALKDYYVAIGGNAETVESITTIYDMIEAISSISSYGLPDVGTEDAGDILAVDESGKWAKTEPESGLPEVSAEDNGDVLAVVEGAWAKKTPESGGGVCIIPATIDRTHLNIIFSDMTLADVYVICENNKDKPIFIVCTDSANRGYRLVFQMVSKQSAGFDFLYALRLMSAIVYYSFAITSGTSSQVTFAAKTINDPA